ncbi:hypothetical protein Vretifemale_15640 [Volvox reticuliferus]|uniref:Uncharacterized protein n=1 Tax=Volvox reticuliferus TaxID=1737510 RepID=A0A8J4CVF6_9CHLO|nr:hypothetical protein Vretifemale_15640 [Volvox reticuliferus]
MVPCFLHIIPSFAAGALDATFGLFLGRGILESIQNLLPRNVEFTSVQRFAVILVLIAEVLLLSFILMPFFFSVIIGTFHKVRFSWGFLDGTTFWEDLYFVLLPDMAAAARCWARKATCGLLYRNHKPHLTNNQLSRLVRINALAGVDICTPELQRVRAILLREEELLRKREGAVDGTAGAIKVAGSGSGSGTGARARLHYLDVGVLQEVLLACASQTPLQQPKELLFLNSPPSAALTPMQQQPKASRGGEDAKRRPGSGRSVPSSGVIGGGSGNAVLTQSCSYAPSLEPTQRVRRAGMEVRSSPPPPHPWTLQTAVPDSCFSSRIKRALSGRMVWGRPLPAKSTPASHDEAGSPQPWSPFNSPGSPPLQGSLMAHPHTAQTVAGLSSRGMAFGQGQPQVLNPDLATAVAAAVQRLMDMQGQPFFPSSPEPPPAATAAAGAAATSAARTSRQIRRQLHEANDEFCAGGCQTGSDAPSARKKSISFTILSPAAADELKSLIIMQRQLHQLGRPRKLRPIPFHKSRLRVDLMVGTTTMPKYCLMVDEGDGGKGISGTAGCSGGTGSGIGIGNGGTGSRVDNNTHDDNNTAGDRNTVTNASGRKMMAPAAAEISTSSGGEAGNRSESSGGDGSDGGCGCGSSGQEDGRDAVDAAEGRLLAIYGVLWDVVRAMERWQVGVHRWHIKVWKQQVAMRAQNLAMIATVTGIPEPPAADFLPPPLPLSSMNFDMVGSGGLAAAAASTDILRRSSSRGYLHCLGSGGAAGSAAAMPLNLSPNQSPNTAAAAPAAATATDGDGDSGACLSQHSGGAAAALAAPLRRLHAVRSSQSHAFHRVLPLVGSDAPLLSRAVSPLARPTPSVRSVSSNSEKSTSLDDATNNNNNGDGNINIFPESNNKAVMPMTTTMAASSNMAESSGVDEAEAYVGGSSCTNTATATATASIVAASAAGNATARLVAPTGSFPSAGTENPGGSVTTNSSEVVAAVAAAATTMAVSSADRSSAPTWADVAPEGVMPDTTATAGGGGLTTGTTSRGGGSGTTPSFTTDKVVEFAAATAAGCGDDADESSSSALMHTPFLAYAKQAHEPMAVISTSTEESGISGSAGGTADRSGNHHRNHHPNHHHRAQQLDKMPSSDDAAARYLTVVGMQLQSQRQPSAPSESPSKEEWAASPMGGHSPRPPSATASQLHHLTPRWPSSQQQQKQQQQSSVPSADFTTSSSGYGNCRTKTTIDGDNSGTTSGQQLKRIMNKNIINSKPTRPLVSGWISSGLSSTSLNAAFSSAALADLVLLRPAPPSMRHPLAQPPSVRMLVPSTEASLSLGSVERLSSGMPEPTRRPRTSAGGQPPTTSPSHQRSTDKANNNNTDGNTAGSGSSSGKNTDRSSNKQR